MTDPQPSDAPRHGDKPGKSRTLWHPLLARLLDFSLSSAYTVQTEVFVGKMPLRVDILLLRRDGGELPEPKRREVPALLPLLNRFTLIEFKGPTDSLERGDFAQLVGCAFLWHSQQTEPVPHDAISLVVLAPTVNAPLRDELRLWNCSISPLEPGIFRVTGLPMTIWVVETDTLALSAEPVLSLVSRVFLREHRSIIEKLTHAGHSDLTLYAVQLIHQLQIHREDFAVPTGVVDEFTKLDEKLVKEFLATVSADWRVSGLTPEERVRGLSLEERLAGLSEDEKARLRDSVQRKEGQ